MHGELWRAVAQDGPVATGETVRITGVDGLTLKVVNAAEPALKRAEERSEMGGLRDDA